MELHAFDVEMAKSCSQISRSKPIGRVQMEARLYLKTRPTTPFVNKHTFIHPRHCRDRNESILFDGTRSISAAIYSVHGHQHH